MLLEILDSSNYFFNPYALPSLFIAAASLFLTLRLLATERFSMVALTLTLETIAIAIWLASNFFCYSSTKESLSLWWARASYLGIPFIPSGAYHFAMSVLKIDKKNKKIVWTAWTISALFAVAAVTTDRIIAGVIHYPWGNSPKMAPLNIVLIVYMLTIHSMSLRHLWIGRKEAVPNSIQSKRIKSFLTALGIGSFGLLDYLAGMGVPVYPFGFLWIFIALWILNRTVTKYRLVDITPRFAAQSIIDTMNDALLVLDAEGVIRLVNRATTRVLGYPESRLVGRHVSTIFDGSFALDRYARADPHGSIQNLELPYDHPDGTGRVISLSASLMKDKNESPLAHVYIARDITAVRHAETEIIRARDELEQRVEERSAELRRANEQMLQEMRERKKMEEELLKAQRLESLGVLAGGIAHDFNNILTGVLGYISLVRKQLEPDGKLNSHLEQAEKASLRAKALTKQLLTFSRGGSPIKRTIHLEQVLRDSVDFALRGANVVAELRLANDLWPVEADAGQLGQVFNNLIINACQAMPSGGTLQISADNVTADREIAALVPRGRYARIEVKDHGIGIPEDHRERIFDPYFTTKQAGSGLGLAVTYSIIRNHGGCISVDSKPGTGATFTIYLPAASDKTVIGEPIPALSLARGTGRVLVMDDEEIVRNVACDIIKSIGYEVEAVKDGTEAIDAYRKAKECGRAFDAVIMDLTIPGGLGGKETIAKLQAIDPEIKAIVSSGYSDDPILANHAAYGFKAIIAKPYTIDNLGHILQKVIASS